MDKPTSNSPRRILVTGATGRLGRHVCRALMERGYEVRATDRRFQADFVGRVLIGDLRDEAFVYGALEGSDVLVHLGNHPHPGAGPSRPGLLSENTQMNANVMYAALDLGVRTIVFASSIQVMLRSSGTRGLGPFALPYLPLDSSVPADPGQNPYALSKEYGERLLQVLAQANPTLSTTSLRFPMLPEESWLERIAQGVPKWTLNWADGLTYLPLEDAAEVIARVIQQNRPGYRQYFPATSFDLKGYPLDRLIREHYPDSPLRRPPAEVDNFVDQTFATDLEITLRPRVKAIVSDGTHVEAPPEARTSRQGSEE